jgi:hypothetical protein
MSGIAGEAHHLGRSLPAQNIVIVVLQRAARSSLFLCLIESSTPLYAVGGELIDIKENKERSIAAVNGEP